MTTRALLIAARARIADEQHWTTGAYARNADGEEVAADSINATCWCALGALMVDGIVSRKAYALARQQLIKGAGYLPHQFNDTRTHAEVLALFDAAIHAQPGA